MMIDEKPAMTDGARKRTHLRPRLCGEKERPYEEEEEQSAGRNFMPDQTTTVETTS